MKNNKGYTATFYFIFINVESDGHKMPYSYAVKAAIIFVTFCTNCVIMEPK